MSRSPLFDSLRRALSRGGARRRASGRACRPLDELIEMALLAAPVPARLGGRQPRPLSPPAAARAGRRRRRTPPTPPRRPARQAPRIAIVGAGDGRAERRLQAASRPV